MKILLIFYLIFVSLFTTNCNPSNQVDEYQSEKKMQIDTEIDGVTYRLMGVYRYDEDNMLITLEKHNKDTNALIHYSLTSKEQTPVLVSNNNFISYSDTFIYNNGKVLLNNLEFLTEFDINEITVTLKENSGMEVISKDKTYTVQSNENELIICGDGYQEIIPTTETNVYLKNFSMNSNYIAYIDGQRLNLYDLIKKQRYTYKATNDKDNKLYYQGEVSSGGSGYIVDYYGIYPFDNTKEVIVQLLMEQGTSLVKVDLAKENSIPEVIFSHYEANIVDYTDNSILISTKSHEDRVFTYGLYEYTIDDNKMVMLIQNHDEPIINARYNYDNKGITYCTMSDDGIYYVNMFLLKELNKPLSID